MLHNSIGFLLSLALVARALSNPVSHLSCLEIARKIVDGNESEPFSAGVHVQRGSLTRNVGSSSCHRFISNLYPCRCFMSQHPRYVKRDSQLKIIVHLQTTGGYHQIFRARSPPALPRREFRGPLSGPRCLYSDEPCL